MNGMERFGTGADVQLDERIAKEQLRTFVDNSPTAILGAILVGLGAVALFWGHADNGFLMGWYGVLVVTYLARLGINRRFKSTIDRPDGVTRWSRLFTVMMAFYGALWGLLPTLFFDPVYPTLSVYLMIIVVGVTGGALGSSSSFGRGFSIFVVCMCGPVVVKCALIAEPDYYVIGALFAFFIVMMIRYGKAQSAGIRTLIQDKYTVDDLLLQTEAAQSRERERQNQIEAILKTNPGGISIAALDGQLLYTNPQFDSLFGVDPAGSAVGLCTTEFFARSSDYTGLRDKADNAPGMLRREVLMLRRDTDEEWWCQVSHAPFEFAGKPAFIAWYHDISDQKKARQDAAEKAELLETTLANIDQGIIVRDAKDNILLFNDRLSEILDVPRDLYVLNTSSHDLSAYHDQQSGWRSVDTETAAKLADWESRRAEGRPVERLSYERPDHRGRILLAVRQPMPNGLEVRTFQDITELKEAERRALEQNRLLEVTLQSMGQGLIVVDANGMVIAHNERYREHFDAPPGYFDRPRGYMELIADFRKRDFGDDWEKGLEDLQIERRTTDIVRREVRRPNGMVLDVLSVPIMTGGFVVTSTDVTESIRAADEIRLARDQAEAATRVKSQFLANMSHEIRTPLSGISGFLELLQLSKLDENQEHCVKSASVAADALIGIIGDVLDFSKIEAGRLDINMVDVEILRSILEVVSLLSPRATERGCRIAVQVAPDLPSTVPADPLRLKQVLMNITGNAIKFAQDGLIHIAVDPVEDPVIGPAARFMVTDTGVGFDAEKAPDLFNEFAQADASTTRRFGGTGLGLAISKRLTELMGGHIDCIGESDNGAVFWFLLPLGDNPVPRIEGDFAMSGFAGVRLEAEGQEGLLRDLERSGMTVRRMDSAEDLAHPPCNMDLMIAISDTLDQGVDISCHFTEALPPIRFLVADQDDFHARQQAFRRGYTHLLKLENARKSLAGYIMSATMGATELDGAAPMDPTVESLRDAIDAAMADRPVLLIDDLEMNRTIASRQVESLGLDFETAENGERGLAKAVTGRFSMVIVDCSMPVMDGYEFTERFRDWERETDQARRTPVVALTANATVGDAERCLAAGMDDYMAKPVTLTRLSAMILRWLSSHPSEPRLSLQAAGIAPAPAPVAEETTAPRSDPIDFQVLADILGDSDRAFLTELLKGFEDSYVSLWAGMADALANNDLTALREISHSAKGAAANAGATILSDLLKDLETAAKEGDGPTARSLWPRVEAESKATLSFINAL